MKQALVQVVQAAIAQAGPLARLPLAGKLSGFALGTLINADEGQLRASITMTVTLLQAAMDEDDRDAQAALHAMNTRHDPPQQQQQQQEPDERSACDAPTE